MEGLYSAKGHNIQLPRISSSQIKSEDLNNVIEIINDLNILTIQIPLFNKYENITALAVNEAFDKMHYVRFLCDEFTECYQNKDNFGGAIYQSELLQIQNDLLFSSSRNQYMGKECPSWYEESEMFWADKKLDPNLSNVINDYYQIQNDVNHYYVTAFKPPIPTCGQIRIATSAPAHCAYSGITLSGEAVRHYSNANTTLNVNKGQSYQLGSHCYGYISVRAGY